MSFWSGVKKMHSCLETSVLFNHLLNADKYVDDMVNVLCSKPLCVSIKVKAFCSLEFELRLVKKAVKIRVWRLKIFLIWVLVLIFAYNIWDLCYNTMEQLDLPESFILKLTRGGCFVHVYVSLIFYILSDKGNTKKNPLKMSHLPSPHSWKSFS